MNKMVSSREFNQDIARAKRDALEGPVIITDRGRPAHVLMSIEDFEKLNGATAKKSKKSKTLAEALSHPASAHIDFEIPQSRSLPRIFDFD